MQHYFHIACTQGDNAHEVFCFMALFFRYLTVIKKKNNDSLPLGCVD